MLRNVSKVAISAAMAVVFASTVAVAHQHGTAMKGLANGKATAWVNNPAVIKAIKAQNAKHASLSQADIDRLDKTWRAETKASAKPFIDAVLGNALSSFLKKVRADSQGLLTEIFVMDNKGLNVGQSDVTSDYWQGDEAKWKKTYKVGPDAVHIGKIKEDESTQMFQSQLSLSIIDPATKKVIGAVTIGVNVAQLLN